MRRGICVQDTTDDLFGLLLFPDGDGNEHLPLLIPIPIPLFINDLDLSRNLSCQRTPILFGDLTGRHAPELCHGRIPDVKLPKCPDGEFADENLRNGALDLSFSQYRREPGS